jgi:hypothetical protein
VPTKSLSVIAVILLLAACDISVGPNTPTPIGTGLPDAAEDTCNANQYASLIGEDATALERVLLLGQVRVIRPNQAVTMDLRPGRINFNISSDNRIRSISCS